MSDKVYNSLRDLVDDGETPKDIEYIFMCWGDDKRIADGIVVTDVKLSDPKIGGYNFIDKETGIEMHTNYPWALMENTPENQYYIDTWKLSRERVKAANRECDKLRLNIATLEHKENNNDK